MERYIYLDNKIIVFIITDPKLEESIKINEIKEYKIYNICRICHSTKIIKIYDFNTKEEFKKIGSQNKKYILNQSLNSEYINYKKRYEYYISMESLISHNYKNIYKYKEISGIYKIYNKEGDLIEEYFHNNFVKEGEYKIYNKNGVLIMNEYYINGIKNGISKEYNDNGDIILEITYNNGEKIESHKYFYDITNILQNKKIKKFKNNQLINELTTHRNGESSEYNYIDGMKNGNYCKTYSINNNFIIESGIYKDNIIINCIKKIKDTDIILYEKKIENDIINERDYIYKNDQYYLNYEYIGTDKYFKKINYSPSGKIIRFEEIKQIDQNDIHIIKEYKSDKLNKYIFKILKNSISLFNIDIDTTNINDKDIDKYINLFIDNKY